MKPDFRILALAASVTCATTATPAFAAEPPEGCEIVASAQDSTGADLWIEQCDPYKVRAGGENLSPGDEIVLREASKGMTLATAAVPPGETAATTAYWSGTIGYDNEPPYGHIASVEFSDDGLFVVRDY